MTPTVQAFDDDPTVQVDSAAMADGAAEPPPPPPIAAPPQAPPPSDPEIVATADEVEQPAKGGGNKIALLAIAAVLLFAIAGATGLALYKFGVFSPSEQPTIAEVTETDSTASALVGQPGDGTPAEAANVDEEQPSDGLPLESLPEGVESESESGQTESSSTRGVAPTGASGGARTGADSGGSGGGGPNSTGTANVPPPAKAGTNPAAEARTQEPPAVRPQPRVGRGVAVIHLGEPLLAATASDYVTEALSRRGLEVFDGGGIPGVMDLIDNGPDGNGPNLAELVRPHARWLVVIRAEYTGDRPLTSIAGYDREFQSRLHVVAQDLMDGRPFGKGIHVPIGYTHLTVEKKVADTLRPRLRDAATRMAAIGN